MRGTTRLVLFDGITAKLYVHILEIGLLPSVQKLYPGNNYLFMQDNDLREFFLRTMESSGGKVSRSEPYRESLARAKGIYTQRSKAHDQR